MSERLTDEQLRHWTTVSFTAINALLAAKDREVASLRAAWKIAEPHLPQDVYRRALAALDASR